MHEEVPRVKAPLARMSIMMVMQENVHVVCRFLVVYGMPHLVKSDAAPSATADSVTEKISATCNRPAAEVTPNSVGLEKSNVLPVWKTMPTEPQHPHPLLRSVGFTWVVPE